MNIQIFGVNKCADTRKAQRFFKERGIRFQFVDLVLVDGDEGEVGGGEAAGARLGGQRGKSVGPGVDELPY